MQALINKLKQTRSENKERIVAFQESLAKDAAYALSWSDTAFQSAARVKIIDRVLAAIETGPTMDKLTVTTIHIVAKLARYPSQSTSQTSNLMEQYELAAYAEIVEMLQE